MKIPPRPMVMRCPLHEGYSSLNTPNNGNWRNVQEIPMVGSCLTVSQFIYAEANAQEKFMRIKHAYSTLLNPESQKRYESENRSSDFSYSTAGRHQSRNRQVEEEFYDFGNFLRDVQISIGDLFRDLRERNWETSADSQGKPKSLWEELADIGEELVEFLENELNIDDPEVVAEEDEGTQSKTYGAESRGTGHQIEASKESRIEKDIDEIEATLARLKKELGL